MSAEDEREPPEQPEVEDEGGGDVLDFTRIEEPPPDSLAPPPRERPFDPEPGREKVRARIAYGLTAFVALYAAAAFVALATGWSEIEDLERLQIYFAPVITLAATALGFYFGGKQSGR